METAKILEILGYTLPSLVTGGVAYLLFETVDPDFDIMKIKEQLKAFSSRYTLIIGSGITPENINFILDECHLKGIELKGSNEDKPGSKDLDELASILEIIQIEE